MLKKLNLFNQLLFIVALEYVITAADCGYKKKLEEMAEVLNKKETDCEALKKKQLTPRLKKINSRKYLITTLFYY